MNTPLDPTQAISDSPAGYLWYDASQLTMVGKGWPDESRQYERFPKRAEGVIPDAPWNQSLACSGLSYHFKTDADYILSRWRDYDNNKAIGQAYPNTMSLYVRHNDRWQWLGTAKALEGEGQDGWVHRLMTDTISAAMREYKLYLSMGRGMTSMEIGIPENAQIIPGGAPGETPIVYYGTSIVHGASASRPGNNHVQMIERDLDYPFINLGLSGSARMEMEVIKLVAELDAIVYIVDCLPNMQEPGVRERFVPAITYLREKRPDVPIVIVDSIIYQDGFLVSSRNARCTSSNKAQRELFDQLVADGMQGLHYIEGDTLLPNDGTIDGTHPNDWGYRCMADVFIKVLKPLINT